MARRSNLTPSERSQHARLAAYVLHSQVDSREQTAAARKAGPASLTYWERKVDPDETLDAVERARRAECARKAHYVKMGLRSAQARRARSASRRAS